MKYINKISSEPIQRMFLTGNPGQRIIFELRYLPTQEIWMADITYRDFVLNGISILNSPNLLRGYKNIIPFGLACLTTDLQDPFSLVDFESGYARLFLLTQDEVLELENDLFE